MNCKEITTRINEIKSKKAELDSRFAQGDIGSSLVLKADLTRMLEKFDGEFGSTYYFLRELKKKETWEKIKDCYQKEIADGVWELFHSDASHLFEDLEKVFSDLLERAKIDNQDAYMFFLKKFVETDLGSELFGVDQFVRNLFHAQNIRDSNSTKYIIEKGPKFLLNALHSVFLNKYLSKDIVINLEQPPKELTDNFGCYLKNGTFNIKKAGDNAGLHLNGATLNIEEAGDGLVSFMESGVARAKKTGANAGKLMSGGILRVVEEIEDNFADNSIKGAVILVDRVEDADEKIGSDVEGLVLLTHNEKVNEYTVYHYTQPYYYNSFNRLRQIGSLLEVGRFGKKDVSLWEFENDVSAKIHPTMGMGGGIMVLRVAPKSDIGMGMRNGAVILEDPNITVKEAKSRISREDRSGGMILMRVPDPKRSGKSKLIDLEMPDDWN